MHGSSYIEGDNIVYMGNPCGFLIEIEGKTIYHAGDTGLFGDMKLIGEKVPLDVAMLPIGGNFVMGIDDAVKAVEFFMTIILLISFSHSTLF
jgi:L-ascorbate metabolism protein UlaG (beta-lactamase superfamily)